MHITLRAVLLLLLAVPLIAGGSLAPALEWAGWLWAAGCLALLAADGWLAGGRRRFQIERGHDMRLSLGAENTVRLSLQNRSRFSTGFRLRDETPDDMEVDRRILSGSVGPRSSWSGTYSLRPLRRGDYRFGGINLYWQGPLELVVRHATWPRPQPVKVYPNLLDVRKYDLLLRNNRLRELGLRYSRQMGAGTEFERLREYQPDDDVRRINWKATARRLRPVTADYQTEHSQSVFLLLDTGRMMQSPVARMAKLDYVVNAALLLAYVVLARGDKAGLLTFADQVDAYMDPRAGRGQFYRMLELLYSVRPQPVEPDYQRAISYLARKHRKRSLIILFTDWSGALGLRSLERHMNLLARNNLTLVVTISDPEIHAALERPPMDSLAAYQHVAASQYLEERNLALESLKRRGVFTMDVPANALSISVIDRYLDFKRRARL